MVYNFKEYKYLYDTPAKKHQEFAIANKIMDLLNKNKYNNLEDFINKNSNYQDFLKNNNMDNVIKHFGNTFTQEDYTNVLKNLRKLTEDKMKFDSNNIKTSNINGKEYVAFDGKEKDYHIDNSLNDLSIEEQMKKLQQSSDRFQTPNATENSERLFEELSKSKNMNLNFTNINNIFYNELSDKEKELYLVANAHEKNTGEELKLDLENQLIVDEENEISAIEQHNNTYSIKSDNDVVEGDYIDKNEVSAIVYSTNDSYTPIIDDRLINETEQSSNEELKDDIKDDTQIQDENNQDIKVENNDLDEELTILNNNEFDNSMIDTFEEEKIKSPKKSLILRKDDKYA